MTAITPNPQVASRAAQNNPEKQKLFDNVKGATLGSVPVLLVATILVLANDPVLFRNVVYRGDLLGFLVILISPLLSLVVATFAFLVMSGLTNHTGRSTQVAQVVVFVLIAFTMPMRFAIWVVPILVAVRIAVRLRNRRQAKAEREHVHADVSGSRKPSRWRTIFTVTLVQIIVGVVSGAITMGFNVDPVKIAKSAIIRGLPAEVISTDSKPAPSMITAHVIQAGDQVTTIVTDDGRVQNLWNEQITGRTPCNDRTRWQDRTAVILFLMLSVNWHEATPSCPSVHKNPPAPWERNR